MVGTQYPSPNTRRLKPADGIPRVPKSACHDIRRTAIVRGRRGRRSREGEAAVEIVTGALTANVLNTYEPQEATRHAETHTRVDLPSHHHTALRVSTHAQKAARNGRKGQSHRDEACQPTPSATVGQLEASTMRKRTDSAFEGHSACVGKATPTRLMFHMTKRSQADERARAERFWRAMQR